MIIVMFQCCRGSSLVDGESRSQIYTDAGHQSFEIEGDDGARISCFCEGHMLMVSIYEEVNTLYDCFQRGLSLSGDKRCLGWRPSAETPYKWMTYNEVDDRAMAFASGLVNLHLFLIKGTRMGIYSQNRPEYIIADQAFFRQSITGVPLYDTLGDDALTFIINQADLATIVVDNNAKVAMLLDRQKKLPVLKTLIVMDSLSSDNKSQAEKQGLKLLQFSLVEKFGRENPAGAQPPKASDLCMVCYTSGTTGTPKGAMLTHGNLISTISAGLKVLYSFGFEINSDDCFISYLPLAHSYERVIEAVALMCGANIGFFHGDVKKLMDDIQELQPTVFPSVPRLLNRFYDKVMTGVNANSIKKFMFTMAVNSKAQHLKRGIRKNSIWDKVMFSAIKTALGGRVRIITTGSAPISGSILSFLRCIVGCPIIEGYGQTENSAVCTLTLLNDFTSGHVGPPLPCNLIKLIDVPEMDYFSKNNKGEICLKGPNVFHGYLKDPEKTREALDDHGYLHTGDIGEWLPNGTLKIIDRKKHIFKLAQGEYIAPEKIENILVQSPWVAQIYVHGNSLQSHLVAIVVPDIDVLPSLAGKLGITGSFTQLLSSLDVKKTILKDLADTGKKNGLSPLEQVKDIKLHNELFSVENGLLTPTFKLKRFELGKRFAMDIEKMYSRMQD